MIIINSWYGRTANNILQLIRAVHYAVLNNHNCIKMNKHYLFNSTEIKLNYENNNNKLIISDDFFNLKKFNILDPEPYKMKEYFQKFIKYILKIEYKNKINNNNELYIHFRGGDIFSNSPHKAYVQPPLSYYKNIINEYDYINLVCEDKSNPCINELLKLKNVKYFSNILEKDLSILSNVSNLVIGFTTFGFLLYLMNNNLKNLYIPKYFINELPQGSWGNDIRVHIINLPNYIKVGEWKFNEEQRKLMIEY